MLLVARKKLPARHASGRVFAKGSRVDTLARTRARGTSVKPSVAFADCAALVPHASLTDRASKYMRYAHSPLPDAIKRGHEAVCIRLQQGNLAADYLRMPITRAHDRT